jgi:hypothetical protein
MIAIVGGLVALVGVVLFVTGWHVGRSGKS